MAKSKRKAARAASAPKKAPKPERPEEQQLVVVEGLAPRMQSFNLPHDVYCKALGECRCTKGRVVSSFYSKADQQRHRQITPKLLNASLTVGFRKRVAVPRAALLCPEVKAALEAKPKRLRVRS